MCKLIWLYQLSWKCKLATVTSYKADISSVSPSSERMCKLVKHLQFLTDNLPMVYLNNYFF